MDTLSRSPYRLLAACFLAALVAVVLVVGAQTRGSAQAANSLVGPGESIQAAVDDASPGDTIVVRGVHRENVVITTNRLSLRGGGKAVLRPPATPDPDAICGPAGFCVLGDINFDTGEVNRYVNNVTITGFAIRSFESDGIVALGARGATFARNRAIDNTGYGIAAFSSTGTRMVANVARGSDEAGLYIGDSPRANALVRGNETSGNFLGIFVRNALHGTIAGNETHNNCVGALVLADAPGPAGKFDMTGNEVRNNTRACEGAPDGPPPLSGIGVLLFGATGMEVHGNQITGNRPTGETIFSGGVVVATGVGGTAPTNNDVTRNTILRNDPDIFWDETGSGNRLSPNRCNTSVPARLCG